MEFKVGDYISFDFEDSAYRSSFSNGYVWHVEERDVDRWVVAYVGSGSVHSTGRTLTLSDSRFEVWTGFPYNAYVLEQNPTAPKQLDFMEELFE